MSDERYPRCRVQRVGDRIQLRFMQNGWERVFFFHGQEARRLEMAVRDANSGGDGTWDVAWNEGPADES